MAGYEIKGSKDIVIITAGEVEGEFDRITAEGYEVTVTYEQNRVIAHLVAK